MNSPLTFDSPAKEQKVRCSCEHNCNGHVVLCFNETENFYKRAGHQQNA